MQTPRLPAGYVETRGGGMRLVHPNPPPTNPMENIVDHSVPPLTFNNESNDSQVHNTNDESDHEPIEEDSQTTVSIPVEPVTQPNDTEDFVYVPIPKKLACVAGVAAPVFILIQAGVAGYDLYKKSA